MTAPKIEGYTVCEKLGSGTYSNVYRALGPVTKDGPRDVFAVKCIERVRMKGSAVDNLINEIQLLKNLQHPHIVKLKDFQWDEKFVYLVMEFCNMGDLSVHLKKRGGVPEKVCRQLLRQLASALQHLRERGIAHMDLKPQNLLLHRPQGGDIILKVADFGFAQHMSDEDRMMSMRGSPLYMAPEVLFSCGPKGTGYDASVDMWSVGVILYECVMGKAPYSSKTFDELMEKIKKQKKIEIPPNVKVSPAYRDLLHGLLQHDPKKRMSHEEFFNHEFLDMKHMPSLENAKKAEELVKKAVYHDTKKEYEQAYHLYCESLRYFVPMVVEQCNNGKNNAFRNMVTGYIRRAEQLKNFTVSGEDFLPSSSSSSNSLLNSEKCLSKVTYSKGVSEESAVIETTNSTNCVCSSERDKFRKLYSMCTSTAGLCPALENGIAAEMYVKDGRLADALRLYEAAISELLKGTNGEPPGERRLLLLDKINEWLKEAESIKSLLESQQAELDLNDANSKEYCRIQ